MQYLGEIEVIKFERKKTKIQNLILLEYVYSNFEGKLSSKCLVFFEKLWHILRYIWHLANSKNYARYWKWKL
jgi:hypothetical protein